MRSPHSALSLPFRHSPIPDFGFHVALQSVVVAANAIAGKQWHCPCLPLDTSLPPSFCIWPKLQSYLVNTCELTYFHSYQRVLVSCYVLYTKVYFTLRCLHCHKISSGVSVHPYWLSVLACVRIYMFCAHVCRSESAVMKRENPRNLNKQQSKILTQKWWIKGKITYSCLWRQNDLSANKDLRTAWVTVGMYLLNWWLEQLMA